MTSHNFKMWAMIMITFIIGGLDAIKGSTGAFGTYAMVIIPVLLAIEHAINGNTDTTTA